MILSSGYLFAEGIIGVEPPLDEIVLFEDGAFNHRYVPSGFDYSNNRLVVATQKETSFSDYFDKAAYDDFQDGVYADYLNNGTTFKIQQYGIDGEDMAVDSESGYLVWDYGVKRQAEDRYNRFPQDEYVIPVCNLGDVLDFVCMRCRLVTSGSHFTSNVAFKTRSKHSPTSVYVDNTVGVDIRAKLYQKGWVDVIIDNSNSKIPIDYIDFRFYAELAFPSYGMQGDDPYKIEISKIWVTKINPN